MQEDSQKQHEGLPTKKWLWHFMHDAWYRGIEMSLAAALVVVAVDVVLNVTYTFSIIVCPIWFFFSVARSV